MKAIKIAGRDAGTEVDVLEIKDGFAICKGKRKERKINIKHLEFIEE